MAKANVNLSVPLQIVAFRNTKEMRQVAPMFDGKPTEVAGIFQAGQDRNFIMLDMSVENPWTVVFHEYAHQLMDGNLPFRTDPWFEEGFAQYFSSIEVDNKGALIGKIPPETYQFLQPAGWMNVSDLFRVQRHSKTYNETGDHRTTFYVESGVVVHYLTDNHLMSKLPLYFEALELEKKTVEQAVQAAFGMTVNQFNQALRLYLDTRRPVQQRIVTPGAISSAQFTAAPVSAADARALVADIHAHSPDYKDKALDEFQDVLKTDPNNAPALRGAGFASLQKSDFAQARRYLRRAVDLDSKDARVHLYYAMLMNQEGVQDEEGSGKIEKELETAIALDPTLADAYSLLGFVQTFSGDPEMGIASLKKALELAPRNERYLFNLANAYMADQQVDEAIAIFRSLAQNGNPQIAIQASQALAQALNSKAKDVETRDGEGPVELEQEPSKSENDPRKEEALRLPLRFLKGKLIAVDCSAAPEAVITVSAGSKSVKVHIPDIARIVLIGADKFSCNWKDVNVAVNYRDRTDEDGDLVSFEMR